jgi:hypothetical protein
VSPSELAGRAKSSEFSLPDDSLTLASTLPRNRQLAVGTQLRGRVNFVLRVNSASADGTATSDCVAEYHSTPGTLPSRDSASIAVGKSSREGEFGLCRPNTKCGRSTS